MKKVHGLLTAAAAIGLAMGLTACGGNKSANADQGSAANGKSISLMVPYIETEPPAKDNPLLKQIEKYTGYQTNVTWVPNTSYEDKMNITLASDSIPQVMVIQGKTGGFIKSAQSGAFWDLTNRLKDYPNLAKANENVQENASVNGKVFGIYRSRDVIREAVIIRKDWLKKLNLKVPETVEDLYNIAKAFKNNDPDGNGKNDTYGLIIPSWPGLINSSSPYDALATWFGAGNAWTEKNGKLTPSFMNSKYLDSMKFVKKMVDEGLVNTDYATLSADKWNTPFVNGKGGIIVDTYSRAGTITSLFKQSHPDNFSDYVTFTGNLKGPDGKLHALPTDGYSGFLAIPKAAVKTEAQLKKVLTYLDKLNTKKGLVLLNNGIEGKNFTVGSDNLITRITPETPTIQTINKAVQCYAQMSMGVNEANKPYASKPATDAELADWNKRQALMKADEKHAVFNPAASIVTDTYASKGAQLDQIITDARLKYIAGQNTEAQWKDAIKLWQTSGGAQLAKETNAAYAKMNK